MKYSPIQLRKLHEIFVMRFLYGLFSISIAWGSAADENWFAVERLGFHIGKGVTVHFFTELLS